MTTRTKDRFVETACPHCGQPTVVDRKHEDQGCDWSDDEKTREMGGDPCGKSFTLEETDVDEMECDSAVVNRLEYAPHHVPYVLEDGELVVDPSGVELLDADWEERDSWWCTNCDTHLESEAQVREHLN